jgi:putative nucleotidyltransferase-like protein
MAKPEPKPKSEVCPTSSNPVGLPKKQRELFRDVLSLFEDVGLPYAVAGAFALREHTGVCRFTKDLDLFLRPEAASEALAILREEGFECEIRDPVWLAKAHRDGFFVDLITGMSNGVMSVDASWIERARPASVLGVHSRVLAPEELLASKLFVVRRERFDGADIAHILFATHGKLDWNRILKLVGEHWELLLWALVLFRYVYPAHSNYVPQFLWQDLLRRFSEQVQLPNTGEGFRGGLIDDATFAIDVEEWGFKDILSEHRARRTKIEPVPGPGRRLQMVAPRKAAE